MTALGISINGLLTAEHLFARQLAFSWSLTFFIQVGSSLDLTPIYLGNIRSLYVFRRLINLAGLDKHRLAFKLDDIGIVGFAIESCTGIKEVEFTSWQIEHNKHVFTIVTCNYSGYMGTAISY